MKQVLFTVSLATLTLISNMTSWAQAPTAPAQARIIAPVSVPKGSTTKATVELMTAAGTPAAADRDIVLHVAGANAENSEVVIPKGHTSAEITLKPSQPGLARVSVEPVNAPEIKSASTSVGVAPEQGYTPAPPFGVSLSIIPRSKLLVGVDRGTILAVLTDHANVPVPATGDIEVSFPGFTDLIDPNPLHIRPGHTTGEAVISSRVAGLQTLSPTITPPFLSGQPVARDRIDVQFVSPIAGARTVCLWSNHVNTLRRPKIPLRVELVDANGNSIASDQDRDVLLRVEPPEAGTVIPSEITILQGQKSAQTYYVPTKAGIATVKAIAGTLPIADISLEFQYRYLAMLLLAVVGGATGGFIRGYMDGKRAAKQIIGAIVLGMLSGVLTFVLAPLLVTVSFKPDALASSSKLFEAFAWGVIGGYLGIAMIAGALDRFGRGPAQPAAPPSAGAAAAPGGTH